MSLDKHKNDIEPYDNEQKIFIGFFIALVLAILIILLYIVNKPTLISNVKTNSYKQIIIPKALTYNHSIKYKRIKLNY
jgi:hypothetical protein